ncbi:regulating synaptic membrane exocytosis protein 1-like isoform X1 [Neolamprologus brichardi]|uniref:regulating synaptic membrane exocytosis protein 1-like isoform X1 n=1 Tax=Neolamprologus brichardi TaxID=32507 RepID=UPI0003EC3323|nr:regulating synaptic membrane exocytosis protein 1-like isoform X1 [Neolamprologus brichardi]
MRVFPHPLWAGFLAHSSTLPACLKSKPPHRQEGGSALPRSILTHRVLRFTDEVTVSDLQPSLDRVRSASTTCLRPDFHSTDRDRCSNSLPRTTPPSPRILVEHVAPEEDRYTGSTPLCRPPTRCGSACLLIRP